MGKVGVVVSETPNLSSLLKNLTFINKKVPDKTGTSTNLNIYIYYEFNESILINFSELVIEIPQRLGAVVS